MGPPLKAAENSVPFGIEEGTIYGFNGAAAKSSGKCNRAQLRFGGYLQLQWGRR